jgi:hypothetical protein
VTRKGLKTFDRSGLAIIKRLARAANTANAGVLTAENSAMRVAFLTVASAAAALLTLTGPALAQTSSSTTTTSGGGSPGPCISSSEPDVCITAPPGQPIDVPEPDMALAFGVSVVALMLARRFGDRPRN